MKRLIAFSLPFFLSGCLLDQNPPTNPVSDKTPIQGRITLEDIVAGSTGAGSIKASFHTMVQMRGGPPVILKDRGHAFARAVVRQGQERSPQCDTGTIAKTTRAVQTEKVVSVGNLLFGSAFDQTLQSIPYDAEKGEYQKDLTPGFPSGIYVAGTQGTERISKFASNFFMPDPILDPSLNGAALDSAGLTLKKSDGAKFLWRSLTAPNVQTIIMAQMITETDSAFQVVACQVFESDLIYSGGMVEWEISPTLLSGLTPDVTARIFLIRGIVVPLKERLLDLQFQGLRTNFVLAPVEP